MLTVVPKITIYKLYNISFVISIMIVMIVVTKRRKQERKKGKSTKLTPQHSMFHYLDTSFNYVNINIWPFFCYYLLYI